MDQVQTAGEFSVETCELISSKGITLDISSLLLEINLFEDIYSSAVQGSIVCVDSNSVMPLSVGWLEEFLDFLKKNNYKVNLKL